MLLRLESDQLLNVVVLQRRELDEAGENRLAGNRITGLDLADFEALGEIGDGDPGLRDFEGLERGIRDDGLGAISSEGQAAAFRNFENGHADALGSDVEYYGRLIVSHDSVKIEEKA